MLCLLATPNNFTKTMLTEEDNTKGNRLFHCFHIILYTESILAKGRKDFNLEEMLLESYNKIVYYCSC